MSQAIELNKPLKAVLSLFIIDFVITLLTLYAVYISPNLPGDLKYEFMFPFQITMKLIQIQQLIIPVAGILLLFVSKDILLRTLSSVAIIGKVIPLILGTMKFQSSINPSMRIGLLTQFFILSAIFCIILYFFFFNRKYEILKSPFLWMIPLGAFSLHIMMLLFVPPTIDQVANPFYSTFSPILLYTFQFSFQVLIFFMLYRVTTYCNREKESEQRTLSYRVFTGLQGYRNSLIGVIVTSLTTALFSYRAAYAGEYVSIAVIQATAEIFYVLFVIWQIVSLATIARSGEKRLQPVAITASIAYGIVTVIHMGFFFYLLTVVNGYNDMSDLVELMPWVDLSMLLPGIVGFVSLVVILQRTAALAGKTELQAKAKWLHFTALLVAGIIGVRSLMAYEQSLVFLLFPLSIAAIVMGFFFFRVINRSIAIQDE